MYCRKCGSKLGEGEKFCTSCGNRVAPLKQTELQNTGPSIDGYKKIRRLARIKPPVIICAVLIIVLAGGIYGIVHSSVGGKYRALVENSSGKFGYIDKKCEEVIACQYDAAYDFDENGLAAVAREIDSDGNMKWGIIDSEGKEVVPMIYDRISESGFSNNGLIPVARIRDDGSEIVEWGFVDDRGGEVVACKYMSLMWDGSFIWNKKGLTTVGQLTDTNSEGEHQYGYGVIDESGATVIPLQYSSTKRSIGDSGLVAVQKQVGVDQYGDPEYSWGYVDMDNNEVIPFIYEDANSFADNNLALVSDKTYEEEVNFGYINVDNEVVIPFEYGFYHCYDFEANGLALVTNSEGDEGYIDENGKMIISLADSGGYSHPFGIDGKAIISKNVGEDKDGYDIIKYGLINESGKQIIGFEYDHISNINTEGYRYAVKSETDQYQHGVLNEQGKVIVPIEYDMVKIGRVKNTLDNQFYNNCDMILLGEETGVVNERTEYRCTYVDGKGKLVMELPEQYINAGVFMKVK